MSFDLRRATLLVEIVFGLGLLLASLPLALANSGNQRVRLRDRTDWWSISNENFHRTGKPGSGELDERNFEIDGISLGRDQFEAAAARLGRATIVERGDASTGRQQICYAVRKSGRESYLVLEFGEDESAFYLFADGSGWDGRHFCANSRRISSPPSTASGLRLGLTPSQVKSILGEADSTNAGRLVYWREIKKRTTPEEFARMRRDYPEKLSDTVAHQKFDLYSVDVYIEARFGTSGLSYLAVSKSDDSN